MPTSHSSRVPRADVTATSAVSIRLIVAPLLVLTASAVLLLSPALASADTSNSLTVVGTSDVSDSGLIPNVIQPGFQKAYPKYTFKYVGTATGTAISDAESGSLGASALIVHAASLENQFVGSGFSFERFGRAIFTNDFVLAGAKADPAGTTANAAHNIAQAFADVATAGINGGGTPKATFVSRGGTPGTTVEEHKIWALVSSAKLAPSGLLLCTVNAKNGGGETPIAPGHGVTASGQPCPNGGALPTGSALPQWYVVTGLTQGPNVIAANACTGYKSPPNSCYVLTDRGTYDYLASGTDPAGSVPNLEIATRDDSPSAPGGQFGLINYFHAYIINPSKQGETVNLPAAQAFMNYITSPTVQKLIAGYLAKTSDPGGAPFKPDASPALTASRLPGNYVGAAKKIKVTGNVKNLEPGYPVLTGKTVIVDQVVGGLLLPVARGRTNARGNYTINFVPPVTGTYVVATPIISQIEDSTLAPPFGDLLSPAQTAGRKITVHSKVTKLFARSLGGRALVFGSVAPGTGHVKATVKVLARRLGTHRAYRSAGSTRLGANDSNFAVAVGLPAGHWQIKVKYQDPHQVVASSSKASKLTVGPHPGTAVTLRSVRVKSGRVTVGGTLHPAAAPGAKVELLAFRTSHGAPRFVRVASKVGHRTHVTVGARLKRGLRWILQLEYIDKGRAPSYSGLKAGNVR
jgi:ABC-type tungstate transport system permease subunit